MKTADWIVDMGPEGGDAGGEVVAQGTPEQIARNPKSYTGQYLKPVLARKGKGGRRGGGVEQIPSESPAANATSGCNAG